MLRRIVDSGLGRGVLMLGGGTALAQGIAILLAPVIARLYTPDAFGLYATYMAVVSLVALLATFKLEAAIMLPRRDRQGAALLMFLLGSCAITIPVLGLPLIVFSRTIAGGLGMPDLAPFLWAAPVSAFLLGSYLGLRSWTMRRAEFADVARNTVVRTGFGAVLACALGLLSPLVAAPAGSGLIAAQIVSESLGNYALARGIRRRDTALFPRPRSRLLFASAYRYRRLALTLTASQGLATIYEKIPILAIGWLYGAGTVGLYAWAERFAVLPALLVAKIIGDVYFQRATQEYHRIGRFDRLMRKTLVLTSALAIVPYGLGIWLAPFLFEWLFGATWRAAGEIASILLVGGLVAFVVTPIDTTAVICRRDLFIFLWHLARLIGNIAIALAAFMFSLSVTTLLWMLVGLRVVLYVTDGAYAWHLAKGWEAGTWARQLARSTKHESTTAPSSDGTGES